MLDVLKIRAELSKLGHSIDLYSAKGLCELMKDKLSNKLKELTFSTLVMLMRIRF